MQCPCCELTKRELYCASCLREGVEIHTKVKRDYLRDVQNARTHADKLLAGPIDGNLPGASDWRELRAGIAAAEQRCAHLRGRIQRVSSDIEEVRRAPHADITSRQRILEAADRSFPSLDDLRVKLARVRSEQREVGKRIIQARRVLVREAVDVFGVQRTDGWEIAGFELPPPEQFRLHPSSTINAAFVHTIHLLSLLTRYLSITLPFVPTPPGDMPHVGRPLMVPNLPLVATKKYRGRNMLWMSSTAPCVVKSRKGGLVPVKHPGSIVARSFVKHRETLTSYALLACSVAYLAHTQGVPGIGISGGASRGSEDEDDYPPMPAGLLVSAVAVLELIALTAESPDLGVRAHEPGTSEPIRHLGFGLDSAKVVSTVLAAEDARWGRPGVEGHEELSEGWDLMEKE